MYDSLNVLSSMDIIRKDKYNIMYNHFNDYIPPDWGTNSDDEDAEMGKESEMFNSSDHTPAKFGKQMSSQFSDAA